MIHWSATCTHTTRSATPHSFTAILTHSYHCNVNTLTKSYSIFTVTQTAFCYQNFSLMLRWQLKVWEFLLVKQEKENSEIPAEQQRKAKSIAITFHMHLCLVQGEYFLMFFYPCVCVMFLLFSFRNQVTWIWG